MSRQSLVLISPNKGRSVFSIDSQYNLKLLNDMYLLYDDQNDRLTALKEKFGDADITWPCLFQIQGQMLW